MLKYFLLLAILSIILISVFGAELYGQIPTNSTGLGVLVTADANSDTITVIGHTDEITQDVTFRVTSPSRYNTVAIDQVTPDDNGDFVIKFKISSLWSENGFYEIKAKQTTHDNTLYIITVFVEVNDGLTEETEVYRGSYVTSSTLTQQDNEYFIPDSSYLTLSDHEIEKWNRELTKWQNAQNRTDSKIEFYYEKLDTAMIRNQTDKIETYTERIGHSMALSELYDGLIQCLEEQLELLS